MKVEVVAGVAKELPWRSSAPGSDDHECVCKGVNDELIRKSSDGDRLRKFLFTESNRVSKRESEIVLGCMSECKMLKMISKNDRLSARLEKCEMRIEKSVYMAERTSFASVAGKSMTGKKDVVSAGNKMLEKTYPIVAKPNEDGVKMSSEEVKEKVMKNWCSSLDVCVRAMRKARSGGLAIEAASECDVKKLSKCKRFEEIDLKVEPPRKVGPQVVILDVENVMTNIEFLNELFIKNLKAAEVRESEFKDRMGVVNRMNRKGMSVGNVCLKLTKGMYEIL